MLNKSAEIMEFGKQILEVAQENLDVTKDIRQAILKEGILYMKTSMCEEGQ